ncbi:MAG: Outer membrane lipoprotein Omp16 [Alphaproteobacteria bacterium MarineAlpha5_Bin12]|nr:peptidoglycan-associated lipoprotein [Pelagibacteraceae bacterium]PPR42166.1 MAG: Outer membrane lipoprotein Omp16 [Alphaproteobacteria bacterium MarineAlpha5_Bin12]
MLTRILISFFIMIFIAACGSSPKEDAGADGAGGSGLTSVDYTSDGVKAGTGDDLIINVGDRIFFEFASHELNGEAQEQLQAQAAWMKQYSNVTLTVEGHCDERGTREYNIALGERRAQAMKNYLIGLGVTADRLSTISYGKERPAVLGSSEAAWSQNRRAVAVVN